VRVRAAIRQYAEPEARDHRICASVARESDGAQQRGQLPLLWWASRRRNGQRDHQRVTRSRFRREQPQLRRSVGWTPVRVMLSRSRRPISTRYLCRRPVIIDLAQQCITSKDVASCCSSTAKYARGTRCQTPSDVKRWLCQECAEWSSGLRSGTFTITKAAAVEIPESSNSALDLNGV
jgi:hypothetical protein